LRPDDIHSVAASDSDIPNGVIDENRGGAGAELFPKGVTWMRPRGRLELSRLRVIHLTARLGALLDESRMKPQPGRACRRCHACGAAADDDDVVWGHGVSKSSTRRPSEAGNEQLVSRLP
jgi:hypothetical protein